MSLKVWLPLNGNLKNNGVSGVTITPSATPTYASSGKIGSCFTSGSVNILIPFTPTTNEFSFCVWINPNSPSAWTDIFGFGSNNNRLETNGSGKYYWYHGGTGLMTNGYWAFDLSNGVWNHVAVTCDGSYVKFYVNGVLKSTNAQTSTVFSAFGTSKNIRLGSRIGGDSAFKGYMNDVRIYDHCLSVKEIDEISKGLLLHYKLSNRYEIGLANKYSGETILGKSSSRHNGFTMTKLTDERGYNYKFSYTGTGNSGWVSISFPQFTFTVGKRYYYSCKVRCHSANFTLALRAARNYNDWVAPQTNIFSKKDSEWHEYVVSVVINSTFDKSGTTTTSNPLMEFYSSDLKTSGTVYTADFDIKDVQVIESDEYVPFIDNSMSSSIVSDCSGFGNDGTKTGNITWNSDSPRYNGSYNFSADSYIKLPKPLTISVSSLFTVSMWVKPKSGCGDYSTVLSNYNNLAASGFWMAINTESSGTWFYNGNYAKGSSLLVQDTWNHVVMVFNAGTLTWYVNGEATTTTNVSSRSVAFTSNIALGNSYTGTNWNTDFVGNISDFRLYVTCLSDDDIKLLYNSPASLSKNGSLYSYEFEEV